MTHQKTPPRSSFRRALVLSGLFAILLLLGGARPAQGQLTQELQDLLSGSNGAPGAHAAEQPEPPLNEQIDALRKKLDVARSHYESAQAVNAAEAIQQFGVDANEIEERSTLLHSLFQAYQRNISVLEKLQRTRESRADLGAQVEAWQGFQDPPPYTEFDEYMQLNPATNRLETAEREQREAAKALESASPSTDLRGVQWQADKARIARLTAQATLDAFEDDALGLRESIEFHLTARAFVQKKLAVAIQNAPFLPEELEQKLENATQELEKINEELEKTREKKTAADDALTRARDELRAARDAAPASDPQEEEKRQSGVARLERTLEVRQVIAETATAEVDALQMMISIRNTHSSLWRQRYEFAHTEDYAELDGVRRVITERIQGIESWRKFFDSNLRKTETLVGNLQSRLAAWRPDFGDEALAREELASLERRETVFRRGVAQINDLVRLLRHWQSELEAHQQKTSRWEAAISIARDFVKRLWSVWTFPLFSVQESSITINKIVMAFLILLVGLYLSKKVARRSRSFVLARFHADEGFAASLEKGIYYGLILVVLLFALSTVEIPLTVFAFFGGALAIGVGFGAQTLINNFISGLILLIERPIKEGDIVDVEGVRGRVMNIGSRCCQVKLFDGIDILVPNSMFLEQKVVNWTLSDTILRFSVSVGVAYGSPTREVAQLLEKAVHEHGKILKTPEPTVFFDDFGESTLLFTVNFWLEVGRPMDFRVVCSDIRFRIDRLFREAGISIAYPQRDIHLDTLSPIQVSLVEPGHAGRDVTDRPHLP